MNKQSAPDMFNGKENEHGFSLIEIMVSILILATITMGITTSTIAALHFAKHTEANHIASSLAISKVEELAALSAGEVDPSLNGTETAVAWPGSAFTFTRVTTITTNADNSRTVTVDVSSNNASIPTHTSFTTTFAVWE